MIAKGGEMDIVMKLSKEREKLGEEVEELMAKWEELEELLAT